MRNFEENRRYSIDFYTKIIRCVENDFYSSPANETTNDDFLLERHAAYITHIGKLLTLKETP